MTNLVQVDVLDDIVTAQNDERDRVLVSRVTRESILERRLTTQLITVKNEKENLQPMDVDKKSDFETSDDRSNLKQKLIQIKYLMNLSSAKTLGTVRNLARKWYNQNATLLTL